MGRTTVKSPEVKEPLVRRFYRTSHLEKTIILPVDFMVIDFVSLTVAETDETLRASRPIAFAQVCELMLRETCTVPTRSGGR